MKKLLLTALACAFIVSPALASDFQAEQTKVLDRITAKMDKFKDDAKKTDFLTQKKACVEEATDTEGIQACIAKFHPDQLKAVKSLSH